MKKNADVFCSEVAQCKFGDEYVVLEPYAGSKIPILMRHKCGYEWKISPTNFLSGKRCPKCSGVLKYTIQEAQIIFNEHGYTLLSDNYQNANAPLKFVCNKHAERGVQTSSLSAVKNNNGGCRLCINERISVGQLHKTTIDDVRKIYDTHGLILLEDKYLGQQHEYLCRCKIHEEDHPHFVRMSNLVHANQGGCNLCRIEKLRKAKRTSEDNVQAIVEGLGLEYVNTVYNHRTVGGTLVEYRCPKHPNAGVLTKKLDKFKSGQGCPYCNQSHGERMIAIFLSENHIEYAPQQKFDDLLGTGGGHLSYDFYLPFHKLLIEYQGIQHRDKDSAFYKDVNAFDRQVEHDNIKREYASRNGFTLLEIWDYDFKHINSILENWLFGGESNAQEKGSSDRY